MNITSAAATQYIPEVKKQNQVQAPIEKNNEKLNNTNISSHKLATLDDKGNKILDSLLVGKTNQEQETIKVVIDGMLRYQVSPDGNGAFNIKINEDNSPKTILKRLDIKIAGQELAGQNDEFLQVMKQLRKLYSNDYTPLDLKA